VIAMPPLPRPEQLALLDEELQAMLARPAHWVEPPRRHRHLRPPQPLDYRAWLEHVAAGCEDCAAASDDLVALRSGGVEWDLAVPCTVGIRLLPLADVDAACPGIDRGEGAEMLRRLVEHARDLDGWGPEARMNPGQAWGREG
jgi:hypothetical protein